MYSATIRRPFDERSMGIRRRWIADRIANGVVKT